MTCSKCSKKAYKEGLCDTHWFNKREQEVYLDNTDRNNLGIVKWSRDFLPEYARNVTPEMHKFIYELVLSLFDPFYKNKFERLLELINWRGSGKSAVIMILVSYLIAHNGMKMKIRSNGKITEAEIKERLVVIASETGGSAEDFVVRIRDEFGINEKLRHYYKGKFEEATDSETGQWTRRAFKYNSCFVLGIGTGQQVRGKIKGAYRATLFIADDLYSEKNTITEESRTKVRNWWNTAAFNSVDDVDGKCVVLGTIVHEDTILVDLEKNKLWKTIKFHLMPVEKFEELKSKHLKVNNQIGTCDLPFDDIEDEFIRKEKQRKYFKDLEATGEWDLAWPERADLYFIALKYQEAVINNTTASFYQEYFHMVISEEMKKFRKEYFQKLNNVHLDYKYSYNWLTIPELYGDTPKVANIDFGVDMAGVGSKEGDDWVIDVNAALEDNRRIGLHTYIGRASLRDSLFDDSPETLRKDKVVMDRSLIKKVGIADECFRLALVFHPRYIKIGIGNAAEGVIVEEVRRIFRSNGIFDVQVMARPQSRQGGTKEERITNTLLPYYETMSVFHLGDQHIKEHQLEFLGKAAHDDIADAEEVSFWNLQNPSPVSMEYFEPKLTKKKMPKELLYNNMTDYWKVI